jgi:hypothetical protein
LDELFLMLANSVGEARVTTVRERIGAMDDNAIAECDPVDLVQQIMDSGQDDRLDVLLMSEIRIRALRDPVFGAAYLAGEREMVASIAQIIRDIVETGQISLRIDPEEAARLLMVVWEGMVVRGAMGGDDSEDLRRAGSTALGRMVELMKV